MFCKISTWIWSIAGLSGVWYNTGVEWSFQERNIVPKAFWIFSVILKIVNFLFVKQWFESKQKNAKLMTTSIVVDVISNFLLWLGWLNFCMFFRTFHFFSICRLPLCFFSVLSVHQRLSAVLSFVHHKFAQPSQSQRPDNSSVCFFLSRYLGCLTGVLCKPSERRKSMNDINLSLYSRELLQQVKNYNWGKSFKDIPMRWFLD